MGYVNDCLLKPGNYLGNCRALFLISNQAAESFTSLLLKDRDSLHFLGRGANSSATESGATRAGELAPSSGPVEPAYRPSNCDGKIVVRKSTGFYHALLLYTIS